MRSQNEHGRMGDKKRGGDLCGVLGMRLQGYQDSEELSQMVTY